MTVSYAQLLDIREVDKVAMSPNLHQDLIWQTLVWVKDGDDDDRWSVENKAKELGAVQFRR